MQQRSVFFTFLFGSAQNTNETRIDKTTFYYICELVAIFNTINLSTKEGDPIQSNNIAIETKPTSKQRSNNDGRIQGATSETRFP